MTSRKECLMIYLVYKAWGRPALQISSLPFDTWRRSAMKIHLIAYDEDGLKKGFWILWYQGRHVVDDASLLEDAFGTCGLLPRTSHLSHWWGTADFLAYAFSAKQEANLICLFSLCRLKSTISSLGIFFMDAVLLICVHHINDKVCTTQPSRKQR